MSIYIYIYITEYSQAFTSDMCSFTVKVLDSKDIVIQLYITKTRMKTKWKDLFAEKKVLKFQITFQVTFHKEIENSKTKYSPLISLNAKIQIIINSLYVENSLKISYQKI